MHSSFGAESRSYWWHQHWHVGSAAGSNLAGVITELGGKAPMLIFSDADIEQVSGSGLKSHAAIYYCIAYVLCMRLILFLVLSLGS